MALKIQTGVSDFLIFPIPLTNAHSWLSITGSIITAPAAASWHSVYRISHRTYGTDCAVPEAGGMDIFPDLSIRCWKPHVVVPTFTDSIPHIYDDTDRKEHIHYRCRRNSINYISCPTWKQFLAFLFYANELLPLPVQHILPGDDDGSTFSPFTVSAAVRYHTDTSCSMECIGEIQVRLQFPGKGRAFFYGFAGLRTFIWSGEIAGLGSSSTVSWKSISINGI